MGVLLRRHRQYPVFTSLVFLIIFASVSSVLPQLSTAISGAGVQVESEERRSGWRWSARRVVVSQKRQGGPGSWPPSCRSKCGNCTPCKPVHVPIHPGLSVPQEYYPEAWRCKCGNKLYMP